MLGTMLPLACPPGLVCPTGSAVALSAATVAALIDLYDRLPVASPVAWDRESNPCSWQGVECNENRITYAVRVGCKVWRFSWRCGSSPRTSCLPCILYTPAALSHCDRRVMVVAPCAVCMRLCVCLHVNGRALWPLSCNLRVRRCKHRPGVCVCVCGALLSPPPAPLAPCWLCVRNTLRWWCVVSMRFVAPAVSGPSGCRVQVCLVAWRRRWWRPFRTSRACLGVAMPAPLCPCGCSTDVHRLTSELRMCSVDLPSCSVVCVWRGL
jgi:hypothetical protein